MTPSAERTVVVPAGAIVAGVHAHVQAAGVARWTTIGQVAQVSALGADWIDLPGVLVDFGAPSTVSGLQLDSGWRYLDWLEGKNPHTLQGPLVAGQSNTLADFDSATASRFVIALPSNGVTPAQVAVSGQVNVALPAADLEIFVNGTRAWARPGPANPPATGNAPAPPAAPAPFVLDDIDLTQAFQDEVDAGRVPLHVTLRSRTPADLDLTLTSGSYLHRHAVVFAEGPARTVDAAAEGPIAIDVALPPGAALDAVRGVHATVTAQSGPERVVPADGPPLSSDAVLIVDPDRPVSIRLPAAATAALATLAGVRLPLSAGAEGVELRGVLRADSAGEPGDALPRGDLGPAVVDPGGGLQWISLLLAKAQKLPAGAVWLDVVATRGSVRWPLATSGAAAVLRPAPGGGYRAISTVAGIDTAAPVRVVGVPPASAPLFGATLGVDGAQPATLVADGASAVVSIAFPDLPAAHGGAPVAGGLRLVLTARTAGSFTLADVAVDHDRTTLTAS